MAILAVVGCPVLTGLVLRPALSVLVGALILTVILVLADVDLGVGHLKALRARFRDQLGLRIDQDVMRGLRVRGQPDRRALVALPDRNAERAQILRL